MTIKGLRFKPGKVQVRFGNTEKTQLLVDAEYIDSETIKCKTANYEQFGATAVDVKVSINGEGWTVNKLSYSYFANTAARNCTAFGPGVLPNVVFGVGVPFLIQARDTLNERRTSGGDHFAVCVVSVDGGLQGDATIADLQDGRYEVTYSVPQPGVYQVHVSHADLGGSEAVSIRGSPFKVEAADPWIKHRVLGAIPAKRAVSGVIKQKWHGLCRTEAPWMSGAKSWWPAVCVPDVWQMHPLGRPLTRFVCSTYADQQQLSARMLQHSCRKQRRC
jgi:dynein heavy chain